MGVLVVSVPLSLADWIEVDRFYLLLHEQVVEDLFSCEVFSSGDGHSHDFLLVELVFLSMKSGDAKSYWFFLYHDLILSRIFILIIGSFLNGDL